MAITAEQVKKLRDQTGAGMMECKNALTEANGDFEEANTILRKRGLASAAKKAGRTANEGLIANSVAADHSSGILVEVNCESDFVARTPDFVQLMDQVSTEIEKAGDAANEAWLKDPNGPITSWWRRSSPSSARTWRSRGSCATPARATSASTSTWAARSACRWSSAASRRRSPARDEFATLVKEIAMQIAAASPSYVSREAVPADLLEKEKAIYRAQMENSGKPANVHRQDRRGQARQLLRAVGADGPGVDSRPEDDRQGCARRRQQDARRDGDGPALCAAQGRRSSAVVTQGSS